MVYIYSKAYYEPHSIPSKFEFDYSVEKYDSYNVSVVIQLKFKKGPINLTHNDQKILPWSQLDYLTKFSLKNNTLNVSLL